MPTEAATNISQLDPTRPTGGEFVKEGAAHFRLLKQAIKNTFPNVTDPVVITSAELERVRNAFQIPGVLEIGTDGFEGGELVLRPNAQTTEAEWRIDNANGLFRVFSVVNGVNASVAFQMGRGVPGEFTGDLNVTGRYREGGNVLLPPGIIVPYWGTTAPPGWRICDGTNGTPDLRGRFLVGARPGLPVGTTLGIETHALFTTTEGDHLHTTDVQGWHAHGAWTDVQGWHTHGGATAGHVLTTSQLPAHSHGLAVWAGSGVAGGGLNSFAGNGSGRVTTDPTGSNEAHAHGISGDGNHAHNIGMNGSGDHAHNVNAAGAHAHSIVFDNRPPSAVVLWIMKS